MMAGASGKGPLDGDGVVGRRRTLAWIERLLRENAGTSTPARNARGDLRVTKAKQQELFPSEVPPEKEAKKPKRARGCVVCDRKLDPDANAKLPPLFSPEEWEEWRAWLCAACTKTYQKRLKRPPLDKPGAVLGAIEWASTRTWAFARHFLTPRDVVRAGMPTSRALRQLRMEFEREKLAAYTRGVLAAADIAEQFDNESANPSRVSDIVRCKLNAVRLAKPRRNAAHNNSFAQGVALALADLNRKFDQPAMVADVLEETGLTIKQLRAAGVEEHDLRELKKCLRKKGRE